MTTPDVDHFPRRPALAAIAGLLTLGTVRTPARADASASIKWTKAPSLKPGQSVTFVAPAGPINESRLSEAVRAFERKELQVVVPETLGRKSGYLAGSDEQRVGELNAAIRDKNIRAIIAFRGGYGLTRILDKVDYESLRRDPKIIAGFSDITALHLAVSAACRLITFHSPMPEHHLWRSSPETDSSSNFFWQTLFQNNGKEGYKIPVPADCSVISVTGGVAEGRLVGGNLTLICSTLGTDYAVDAKDNILFFEDIDEKPYRIDRYLSQLRLAGVLESASGIVAGTFTSNLKEKRKHADKYLAIVKEYCGDLSVPVVFGFPVGHTEQNMTLPVGARARLDSSAGDLRILENPLV